MTAIQHGGQESALVSFHNVLLHLGFIGVPYTVKKPMSVEEISGGSPYGQTTIAGGDGSRRPSENELTAARLEG